MGTFILDPATDITASVPRISRLMQQRQYKDKQFKGSEEERKIKLATSTTVYIGNLSCYTNEYQLYELFSRCGSIKRVIMGLDKIKKTPCGFCFVEFDERDSALTSVNYLNRTYLDGRQIAVDIDTGFEEGRQFGRGASGGQIGDERRKEREQGGGYQGGGYQGGPRGGPQGGSPILTRSITIVACIALISILFIAIEPIQAASNNVVNPIPTFNNVNSVNRVQYTNPIYIRRAQLSEYRTQFENSMAQFLVNLMKAAKPTLLQAFIKATLADKQLKDIAIGIFFNNTSSESAGDVD